MRRIALVILVVGAIWMLVSPLSAQQLDVDHIQVGITKYKAADLNGAIAEFKTALTAKPDDPDVLNWIGFVYMKQGHAADAIPVLEKAVAVQPSAASLNNLGNAYMAIGQTQKAVKALEKACSLDPKSASAAYNLGNADMRCGRLDEAGRAFTAASTANPSDTNRLEQPGPRLLSSVGLGRLDHRILQGIQSVP